MYTLLCLVMHIKQQNVQPCGLEINNVLFVIKVNNGYNELIYKSVYV